MKNNIIKTPKTDNNCALYSILIDSYNRGDEESLKILIGEELSQIIINTSYEEFDHILNDSITNKDNLISLAFKKFRINNKLGENLLNDDIFFTFGYEIDKDGKSFNFNGDKRINFRGNEKDNGHFDIFGEADLFPNFQNTINHLEEKHNQIVKNDLLYAQILEKLNEKEDKEEDLYKNKIETAELLKDLNKIKKDIEEKEDMNLKLTTEEFNFKEMYSDIIDNLRDLKHEYTISTKNKDALEEFINFQLKGLLDYASNNLDNKKSRPKYKIQESRMNIQLS